MTQSQSDAQTIAPRPYRCGMANESWWTQPQNWADHAVLEREQSRMRQSRFGCGVVLFNHEELSK